MCACSSEYLHQPKMAQSPLISDNLFGQSTDPSTHPPYQKVYDSLSEEQKLIAIKTYAERLNPMYEKVSKHALKSYNEPVIWWLYWVGKEHGHSSHASGPRNPSPRLTRASAASRGAIARSAA